MSEEICFAEMVVRKKLRKPGWVMFAWECVGETRDVIVTGCVPTDTYKSGPRKGRPKFISPGDKCVVTQVEEMDAKRDYERDTGKCNGCQGSGKQWAGWSAGEGSRYRECRRCGSTGIAPAQEQAA
jgi:hypothetical protein